jgi:LacI family gluconate utilization system Gnt-I transcriptional repressor
VALAGFNGLAFLEALPVRLTTVETPRHQMGVEAALHLLGRRDIPDENTNKKVVDLGFRLIEGETC